MLGLGDLDVVRRERKQGSGGRVDFLMHDPEEDIRFEIEIMLGALDETHIIRTIEYWDLERQRYNRGHIAVGALATTCAGCTHASPCIAMWSSR